MGVVAASLFADFWAVLLFGEIQIGFFTTAQSEPV
jgi:hypothetical protein